jgi:hypothetical protein
MHVLQNTLQAPGMGPFNTINQNIYRVPESWTNTGSNSLKALGNSTYLCQVPWNNPLLYCDMTPESQNSPLLDNHLLKRVSTVKDTLVEIEALLRDCHTLLSNG